MYEFFILRVTFIDDAVVDFDWKKLFGSFIGLLLSLIKCRKF